MLHKQGYIVDHLVASNCKIITKNNPFVNKQIVLNLNDSKIKLLKLLSELKKNKYDIIFNFHRSNILTLFLFFIRPKEFYGFSNKLFFLYTNHILYSYNINRTLQEFRLIKQMDNNLQLQKQLEYYPKKNIKLFNFNLPKIYITCNPGGGVNADSEMKSRRWLIEYYDIVFNKLDIPIVILGNGEVDKYISLKIKSKNIINLVNQTTFDETALIIKKSKLYFGNDSSLLFLASAMGVKSLGIFGPTQARAANPIGNKQFFIQSTVECSPCYNPYDGVNGKAYTCKDFICMKDITPVVVHQEIIKLLEWREDFDN